MSRLLNKQRIVLETDQGTAHSDAVLKKVWEYRLKEIAPHYKVVSAKILEMRYD